jgi:hypothetical protein
VEEQSFDKSKLYASVTEALGGVSRIGNRPSWSFNLSTDLFPPVPDGGGDPFTPEQRNAPAVKLDFIYMAAEEELDSITEAAQACAKRGVDLQIGQAVLVMARVKHSLWKLDERVLNTDERARLWSCIGPQARDVVVSMFAHANGLKKVGGAANEAMASFLVSTLRQCSFGHVPRARASQRLSRAGDRRFPSRRSAREGLWPDVHRGHAYADQSRDLLQRRVH